MLEVRNDPLRPFPPLNFVRLIPNVWGSELTEVCDIVAAMIYTTGMQ